VKSWQLIPYDSFEFGFGSEIKVGDIVNVIVPICPHYKERGKVRTVSDLGVEVIGQKPNTKVNACVRLSMAPVNCFHLVLGTTLVFGERRATA
jgi:hypothetical protein